MTMFTVIKTGGKQYRVSEGDSLRIEKIRDKSEKKELAEGDKVSFDEVLLTDDGKNTEIGTPFLKGKKVEAIIEKIGRGKKVVVAKFKSKSRYSVKNGHRQPFFQVKIGALK
jgi:large subunit ribosomal protein L21